MIELGPDDYREWVNALRSGEFPSGRGVLTMQRQGADACYCPLGVLCALMVRSGRLRSRLTAGGAFVVYGGGQGRAHALPREFPDMTVRFPFVDRNGTAAEVADLNDNGRLTQAQMADLIEHFYL